MGYLEAILTWPHETGILSTIRLEAMRDGLEDNAALWMLREKITALKDTPPNDVVKTKALEEARKLCTAGPLAPTIKSVEDMDALRLRVGELLSKLNEITANP